MGARESRTRTLWGWNGAGRNPRSGEYVLAGGRGLEVLLVGSMPSTSMRQPSSLSVSLPT